jgi:CRP/FNR family transcriptional regulator, cyclic AMP receptor protein
MGAMTDLLALAADLPLVTVPAGDVLIEEDTDPGVLYVLVSGAVAVERDGVPFARIDTPGAIFGEMSVVLGRPATATVRATSDLTVRRADDPEAFLTERPGAALHVLRMTAARLDGLTQYLVDVKAQFAEQEGHLGMVGDILDTLVHHQGPVARTGSARDPEGDHVH